MKSSIVSYFFSLLAIVALHSIDVSAQPPFAPSAKIQDAANVPMSTWDDDDDEDDDDDDENRTKKPKIESFSPVRGPIGTEIAILGENFTGTKTVSFNDEKAEQFSVESDEKIRAIVPGKAETGKIKVRNSRGTTTSRSEFNVIREAATVTHFSPPRYSVNQADEISISAQFDKPIAAASLHAQSFLILGNQTGIKSGEFNYHADTQRLTFIPETPFKPGETVTVVITSSIQEATGNEVFPGFQWSFSIASNPSPANFEVDTSYATGTGPHFVGLGDWDRDGNVDVAIPNSKSDNVYTWFNTQGGIFNLSEIIEVRRQPRSLTVGDFDDDGDLDLAVANDGDNSVLVLLNSNGQFDREPIILSVGNTPTYVVSGDLNSDGSLDLVTVNNGSDNISVLLNGSTSHRRFSVDNGPATAVLGDFNNDGALDIAVTNSEDHSVSVLFNDKSGEFGNEQDYAVGRKPQTVVTGDFNRDGQLDLAVTNRESGTISVLFNNAGNFSSQVDYEVGEEPFGLTTGDWDGDEDLDLAITNKTSNDSGGQLYILSNQGQGEFAVDMILDTGSDPRAVNAADFDGDGDLDLAVANWESDNLQIFLNTGVVSNRAPNRPPLLSPENRFFTRSSEITFTWGVPADPENDLLHFRLEIDESSIFDSPAFVFESQSDASGFNPQPPVAQSTESVSFEFTGALPDSIYWWRVAATDQTQYGDFSGASSFIVDTTPPTINSIAFANPDFAPNWFNPERNNNATLIIRYDERFPQRVEIDLGDLGGLQTMGNIPGGFDRSVEFSLDLDDRPDGSFPFTITLFDSAGNSSQATNAIRLDSTPPESTRATSPEKSSSPTFTVSWIGTGTDGDGSGLSGRYDVRVQVNNDDWQTWLSDFQGTSSEYEGADGNTYRFEVAAHDNVGNVEVFRSVAESETQVDATFSDNTAPSISHSPSILVEEGADVTITAEVQDNNRVVESILFYKPGGQRNYQSLSMNHISGNTYQATLPSTLISIRGIDYFIRASDGSNFSYHPVENWETAPNHISVLVRGQDNQGLVKAETQPAGDLDTAFRMISVPLNLQRAHPRDVLEDDLGGYEINNWRFFQYDPETETYLELPNTEPMTPGKAFWLIVHEEGKQLDSGIGETVPTNAPFQITLQQGWNDIGNPFVFPVNWSEMEVVQGSASDIMGPYTYQSQWLLPEQTTVLHPWEGYSIFSRTPTVITLFPLEANLQKEFLPKDVPIADWQVQIMAQIGKARDSFNYAGVSVDAANEWDHRDYLEPPPMGNYVSVSFPHPDWEKYGGNFASDFRPPFVEGQIWEFEVKTNIEKKPVFLQFKNIEVLPPDLHAVLFDMTTGQTLEIKSDEGYDFVPDRGSFKRSFQLRIGTQDYLSHSDTHPRPQSYSLKQNFPNPFNASTLISYQIADMATVSVHVYNVLGQEIRKLVSEEQQPGVYQVHWDGKSDIGKEMGSGIYIVRLQAGTFTQSRKVLLVR